MTHSLRSVAVIRTRAAEFKFFSQFSRGIRLRKRARREKERAQKEILIPGFFLSLSLALSYEAIRGSHIPGEGGRRWEDKFPCLKTVMDEHGAEELIPFESKAYARKNWIVLPIFEEMGSKRSRNYRSYVE